MKHKTQLFFVVLSLSVFFSTGIFAQNSVGFNIGLSAYEGDLHCFEQPELNLWNSSGLTFGFYGKRSLSDLFNARIAYQFVRFQGDDQGFELESGHPYRNFNFTNNMHELTVKLDLEPFKEWKLSPFLSVGGGVAFNNPNTVFDLNNKSTEQLTQIDEDEEGLTNIILAVPVGLGFNVNLSERFDIGTEFAMRLPLSDYLDGVSVAAISEFNDYFGTGVISLNYNLGSTKSNSAGKISMKDKNLAEQMIDVHPPAGDPGDIEPIKTPSQKVDPIPTKEVIEEAVVEEIKTRVEENKAVEVTTPTQTDVDETAVVLEPDSDNDGLVDKLDDCPLVYAKTANGCPEKPVTSDVNCEADFGERTIQFQTSFSDLSNADKSKLNDAVSIMAACPNLKLIIEGHTDSRGSELVNQTLSEKRAKAVKAYMVSRGVETKRIRTFGFGRNQPVADNKTEKGRSLNRRVVVSFF